jgi:PhnB protein
VWPTSTGSSDTPSSASATPVVLAFDAKPDWPDTPAFLRLYVEDSDATFRRALDAGATAVTEVTHLFWGDRVGRVRDPLGNLWWIQARIEEVDEAEMARRMGDPEWIGRMQYVQSSLAFPPDRSRIGKVGR